MAEGRILTITTAAALGTTTIITYHYLLYLPQPLILYVISHTSSSPGPFPCSYMTQKGTCTSLPLACLDFFSASFSSSIKFDVVGVAGIPGIAGTVGTTGSVDIVIVVYFQV